MSALSSLIPFQWMIAVLLLALRLGAMLYATPIFSAADVPGQVRVFIVLALAIALCAGLGLLPDAQGGRRDALLALADRPASLLRAACTELALGATMGLAIHVAFAAFATAGQVFDIQIGFGLAQVFDPASGGMSTVLSTAMNRLGVVVFFLANGHHALVRAVAFSLERVPLGGSWQIAPTFSALLPHLVQLFALCIALAAPIIFSVLLTELALGVLARNLPQVNMLALGLPVKMVVGVVFLCLWLPAMGPALDRIYKGLFEAMDATLSVAAPAAAARAQGAG